MTDRSERSSGFDPLDLLAGANPVPADEVARAHNPAAKAALFQEIIMSTPTPTATAVPTPLTPAPTAPRRSSRPSGARRWLVPVSAAAGLAVAISAALVLVPRGADNAAAALTEAARETSAATSGRVTIEATQIGGSEAGTLDLGIVYNGDDAATTIRFLDPANPEEGGGTQTRLVDGRAYVASEDPTAPAGTEPVWYVSDLPAAQAVEEWALPLDPRHASRGLVELIQAADDVERTGEGRYQATVTVGQLRQLDVLPAGLSFLVPDPELGDEVPDSEQVAIEILVDSQGKLSQVVARVDDTIAGTETVPVDVVVTTTYSDLDAVGPIEAPANAQPVPAPGN